MSGSLLLYNISPKYVYCIHLLSLRFSLNAGQIILALPTSYFSALAIKT